MSVLAASRKGRWIINPSLIWPFLQTHLNWAQGGIIQGWTLCLAYQEYPSFLDTAKFNSCSIHEGEAGILSLGTLYLISESIPALLPLTESWSDTLCLLSSLTQNTENTPMSFGKGLILLLFSHAFYLHLSPFIHAKATAHSEWAISSSVALTVQKYYKLHLRQETGGAAQPTCSERNPKLQWGTNKLSQVCRTIRPGPGQDMQLVTLHSSISCPRRQNRRMANLH